MSKHKAPPAKAGGAQRLPHLIRALERHRAALRRAGEIHGVSFQSGLLQLLESGLLTREATGEIIKALFALDKFYHPAKPGKRKSQDLQNYANAKAVKHITKCSGHDAAIAVRAVTGQNRYVHADALRKWVEKKNLTTPPQWKVVAKAIYWLQDRNAKASE